MTEKEIMCEGSLNEEEVRKNVFGLLSMYVFLLTIMISTILTVVMKAVDASWNWIQILTNMGYVFTIILELLAIVVSHKNRQINHRAAGTNYGCAAMMLSIFMLLSGLI